MLPSDQIMNKTENEKNQKINLTKAVQESSENPRGIYRCPAQNAFENALNCRRKREKKHNSIY